LLLHGQEEISQRQNYATVIPDAKLGELTLDADVNQFISTLKILDEKPIIVGHSVGGLVV
jgi:alpha-beta hydrolase superfamily lysophospholipase